jgi:capsule polysaccharide export protein KpsE/RkpR
LIRIQQSPTGPAEGVGDFFKVQKVAILTNVCISMISMDFFAFFHTVFNAKTFLSQRDHSHTVRVANAQLKKNAGPISQNSSFMLFKAVK